MDILWTAIFLLTGTATGYFLGHYINSPKEVGYAEVQRLMQSVVNFEEIEYKKTMARKMMHDADRRTMPRTDGRAPARIYAMRTRRRIRQTPSDD